MRGKSEVVTVQNKYGNSWSAYADQDSEAGRYTRVGKTWIKDITIHPEVNYTDVETAVKQITDAAMTTREGMKADFEVETYEQWQSTYVRVSISGTREATEAEVARIEEQKKIDVDEKRRRDEQMAQRVIQEMANNPALKEAAQKYFGEHFSEDAE